MRGKESPDDSCDSDLGGMETQLEGKETKIDRMIHEPDNLGKDLYNGKGLGIELTKIEKTKQTMKMIFNSRENSSVTSICIVIIM